MKIGYARVSTEEQNLALQTTALKAAGCSHIYEEKVSGAARKRPQLELALKELREGDTLVVWRLDRVARTVRQLLFRLDQIVESGAKLKSLTEEIDISNAIGRLMVNMLGSFAEFERALAIERTIAGIKAAQERGVKFGRSVVFTPLKKKKAWKLVKAGKLSNKDIAAAVGVSVSSLQIYLREKRGK